MAECGRTLTFLALVAAMSFLLQPALCNLLHAVEGLTHAAQLGSEQAHEADHDSQPELEDVHHCCGGHDSALVIVTPKINVPDRDDRSVMPGWLLLPAPTPEEAP